MKKIFSYAFLAAAFVVAGSMMSCGGDDDTEIKPKEEEPDTPSKEAYANVNFKPMSDTIVTETSIAFDGKIVVQRASGTLQDITMFYGADKDKVGNLSGDKKTCVPDESGHYRFDIDELEKGTIYYFRFKVRFSDITLTQPLLDVYSVTTKGIIEIDYEAVDLGLPSGTLWATTNVGAKNAEQTGYFFQWGATRHITGDRVSAKYEAPQVDRLTAENDAATIYMGQGWCMPTQEDWQELIENVDWSFGKTESGAYVAEGISKTNEKKIFLTVKYYIGDTNVGGSSSYPDYTYYWSSDRSTDYQGKAQAFFGEYKPRSGNFATMMYPWDTYLGCQVRGVKK